MVAGMYPDRERSERYVQGKRSLCRDDCRQCNVDSVKARLPENLENVPVEVNSL